MLVNLIEKKIISIIIITLKNKKLNKYNNCKQLIKSKNHITDVS